MNDQITIFMCGDVMTGRGIDQILPHPGNPVLYESYMKSALGYVRLAEDVTHPLPKPVDFAYIWGDALDELERVQPDMRIINLETAVTRSSTYREKEVNYRMSPANGPCLTAAKIDCCCLANNHVLDWGYEGLIETVETLKKLNIPYAGAGRNKEEAEAPVIKNIPEKGRVIVFSFGATTSGIPRSWAAGEQTPGVNLLKDLTIETVHLVRQKVLEVKRQGDVTVASIHWGGNWEYYIPADHMEFAHALIDYAGVDVVHGHSSHHVKGIEVYKDKLIIYGCGDFLDDYEGISGYESFRDDLGLMYFASLDSSSGKLVSLRMTPTRILHFRVNRAYGEDAIWLSDVLNREGRRLGTSVELNADHTFTLKTKDTL